MKSIRTLRACGWFIALLTLVCATAWPQRAERKPLVTPRNEEVKYLPTGMRTRPDPVTHRPIQYALDGKITYDQSADNYNLEWIGVDGQRKKLTWVPPNKLSAAIVGAVSYDPDEKLFEYSYEVSSLPISQQQLQSLYVTSLTELVSGENPDKTWYSSAFTPYLRQVFRTKGGWAWSQTMGGKIGLQPRETAKGFRLRSSGLPTAISCYVRGYTDALHSSEDVPEELTDAIDRVSWKIPYGFTIGPGLSSDALSLQQIVQNLSRSLEIATKQGWILDGSDTRAINQLFEKISRAVSDGNSAEAVRLADQSTTLIAGAYSRGTLLPEIQGILVYNLAELKESISKSSTASAGGAALTPYDDFDFVFFWGGLPFRF